MTVYYHFGSLVLHNVIVMFLHFNNKICFLHYADSYSRLIKYPRDEKCQTF